MKNLRKNDAITLVALVITIIILIILAGVSLNLALGQNGIFVKSKEAVDKYKDEAQKEQNEMDNLYNTLKTLDGNGDDDQMLGDDPTTTITGGNYDESKGVNTPVIKSGEDFTMELVKYEAKENGAEGQWVSDTNGSSWSYETGDEDHKLSHWANAKVTKTYENNETVDSYFVWIPRFAYKINNSSQKIDVVFLKDKTDTYIENGVEKNAHRVTEEGDNGDPTKNYVVHPAFTKTEDLDGNKTFEYGEWKDELPGIWVGKYETSHTGCTQEKESGEKGLDNNKIKIQPGITSWRNQTIGEFYTAAKEYEADLNSHMLKNSEWGAVAYLTHSKYGRNGHEITRNNNSNYITGIGSGSTDKKDTTTETTNAYNTTTGKTASSTGNEYGIYDLSGGAYEYVAAYYKNSEKLSNGESFADGTSDEYATAYTDTNVESAYKKGDATFETNKWDTKFSFFMGLNLPFSMRGGRCDPNTQSGLFYYDSNNGDGYEAGSFRVCLAIM